MNKLKFNNKFYQFIYSFLTNKIVYLKFKEDKFDKKNRL